MEAQLLKDQSFLTYKPQNQIKNPRFFNHPLISHPSENFSPNSRSGGLLYAPPPRSLSHSFPPSVQYYNNRQQPPLLPLPVPNHQQTLINPSRARGLSCPPVNRKIKSKSKNNTPTPRKPKPNAKVVVEPIAKSEPPKPMCLTLNKVADDDVVVKEVDLFTDISPPPSSLPLPTFFLRPKISCNVGVDTGATNDLCRLLRLR